MSVDSKVIENVAERLRFFFSDANIRGDKFMRKELEEKDGFISIEVLLRFNSIKKHTTDAKVVAQAAKHESVSDRVKLNEDESAVGRLVPFDKEKMMDNVKLSLRVENLPVTEPKEEGGEKKYAVTVDDLIKLFSDYGTVALVKLQRYRPDWKSKDVAKHGRQNSVPTGAAFVEFETEEEQKKAVADLCGDEEKEPEKTLEFGGNKLKVQTMRKWIDNKGKRKSGEKEGKSPHKRDRDNNRKGGNDDKEENPKAKFEEYKLDWKKGRVISLKGLSDGCDREAINEALAKVLDFDPEDRTVGIYADYSRGQPEGAIRFHNEKVAGIEGDKIPEKVLEIAAKLSDGSIEIAGAKVGSATVLEGEEEEKYYKNFIDFKNKQRKQRAESKTWKRPRKD